MVVHLSYRQRKHKIIRKYYGNAKNKNGEYVSIFEIDYVTVVHGNLAEKNINKIQGLCNYLYQTSFYTVVLNQVIRTSISQKIKIYTFFVGVCLND